MSMFISGRFYILYFIYIDIKSTKWYLLNMSGIEVEGTVTQCLPSAKFKVELSNGHVIDAHLSGRLRMHKIRISVGDDVKVEVSPYDLTKGRIIRRK